MTDTTYEAFSPDKRAALRRIRSLSVLMDSAFELPFIKKRVGLDSIIGLVPGIGDGVGMLFSAYIIIEAAKVGAPKATLGKMALNVAIETIVGSVPLLGDVFDAYWKANMKNLDLLERHL